MSPVVIIVFAPVVLIGLVFYSLLFGAALAGIWEAVEERTQATPPASRKISLQEHVYTPGGVTRKAARSDKPQPRVSEPSDRAMP
jgi:hypothetical protein